MDATYTYQVTGWTSVKVVAQAYGTSTYSGNSYNGSPEAAATTTAPSTGFFAEPPFIVVPTLLVVALILGVTTFTISRALRRKKSDK